MGFLAAREEAAGKDVGQAAKADAPYWFARVSEMVQLAAL